MTHDCFQKLDGALSEIDEISFVFHHAHKWSLNLIVRVVDKLYHFICSVNQASIDIHQYQNFWVLFVAEIFHFTDFVFFFNLESLQKRYCQF